MVYVFVLVVLGLYTIDVCFPVACMFLGYAINLYLLFMNPAGSVLPQAIILTNIVVGIGVISILSRLESSK